MSSESLVLSNNEQKVIGSVLSKETSGFSDNDIAVLAGAFLKAAPEILKKAMAIIHEDIKLQAEIARYLHESAVKTIDSNDDLTRRVLENGSANSEVIRELLKKPDLSAEQMELCFSELRFYAQEMNEAKTETQRLNESILHNEQEIDRDISSSSKNRRDAAVNVTYAVGGATLGLIIAPFIWKLLKNVRI